MSEHNKHLDSSCKNISGPKIHLQPFAVHRVWCSADISILDADC